MIYYAIADGNNPKARETVASGSTIAGIHYVVLLSVAEAACIVQIVKRINVLIHYVFQGNAIYIYGLPVGQKISNLKANLNICFNIYEMRELLMDKNEKLCDTNTAYASVVIQGKAQVVEDLKVLCLIKERKKSYEKKRQRSHRPEQNL